MAFDRKAYMKDYIKRYRALKPECRKRERQKLKERWQKDPALYRKHKERKNALRNARRKIDTEKTRETYRAENRKYAERLRLYRKRNRRRIQDAQNMRRKKKSEILGYRCITCKERFFPTKERQKSCATCKEAEPTRRKAYNRQRYLNNKSDWLWNSAIYQRNNLTKKNKWSRAHRYRKNFGEKLIPTLELVYQLNERIKTK